MLKKYNLVSIGESLIDFTPSGKNELGMELFAKNPGGAPSNVLAMHAKLGGNTAFIGKVGNDVFGDFLVESLHKAQINTLGVVRSENVPTTLAFVQINKDGDRDFSFYRNPGADICLTKEELNFDIINACEIFHFGSVSLTNEPSRGATLEAVYIARKNGAIISYDPNYREFLWNDKNKAREVILAAMKLADIVKLSEEELFFLFGDISIEEGSLLVSNKSHASIVMITRGKQGCHLRYGMSIRNIPAFNVKVVDTTGAGDSFLGTFLYAIRGRSLKEVNDFSIDELAEFVKIANAAGSLTTTKKGAIPAMPNIEDINNIIEGN